MKAKRTKKYPGELMQDQLGLFQEAIGEPKFSMIDRTLAILTVLVMLVIYFLHFQIPEDQAWANYCLMMTGFTVVGFIGTQLLHERPVFEVSYKMELMTVLRTFVILALLFGIQIVSKLILSFTTVEQALYYVFAAPAEELFFRVFILSIGLKLNKTPFMNMDKTPITKFLSKFFNIFNIIQAVGFTAIHQNYYGNLPMLLSVFVGGLILGYFYLLWQDATANILAHFLLNIVAVSPMVMELIL